MPNVSLVFFVDWVVAYTPMFVSTCALGEPWGSGEKSFGRAQLALFPSTPMEYHADPMEQYQRRDYPVPKPMFPDDAKHGKVVMICKTCHKPEKDYMHPNTGKHRCTGECEEWSVCRLLCFHPEEQIHCDEILRAYQKNQKAWCEQQNAALAEACQNAKVQQQEEARQWVQEEKAACATDLTMHQLGNPWELLRFLQAFGVSEKSTWTQQMLNNVLKTVCELDAMQELNGANKHI